MKRFESIIIVIFLLMVCVASIQQAQSWNNGGIVGITGFNKLPGPSQEAAAVTEQEREQYQRKIAKSLAEFGDRLQMLQTEWKKRGTNGNKELQSATTEFENKLALAQKQFEYFRSAPAETWDGLKSKMDAAMADLNSSSERAITQAKVPA